MSQNSGNTFELDECVTNFLLQLGNNSGLKEHQRVDHDRGWVTYNAEKANHTEYKGRLSIELRLTHPYLYGLKVDRSCLVLTRFSIRFHGNSTILPKILTGQRFLAMLGMCLPKIEVVGDLKNLASGRENYWYIRSEDNLRALFLKYVWYADFYECLPIFFLKP